jgi:hypothetical protein
MRLVATGEVEFIVLLMGFMKTGAGSIGSCVQAAR